MVKLTLIHGDCLKVLPKIPDESVDLIVTDPPYFLGFVSSAKENKGRMDYGNLTLLRHLFDNLFKEFSRVLKNTGKLFMFTDWRTYPVLYLEAGKYMWIKNLIVWDFGWIKAGTHFRFTHEFILYATMDEAKPPRDRSIPDVWRFPPVNFTVKRLHPAEKPLELIKFILLNSSNEGDTVLDPFLGSGTTMKACLETGRNCIGIEIDEKYIRVTKDRLNWGYSLGDVEFEFYTEENFEW